MARKSSGKTKRTVARWESAGSLSKAAHNRLEAVIAWLGDSIESSFEKRGLIKYMAPGQLEVARHCVQDAGRFYLAEAMEAIAMAMHAEISRAIEATKSARDAAVADGDFTVVAEIPSETLSVGISYEEEENNNEYDDLVNI